ncbi:hypothetical protein TPMD03_22 [Thiohalocapsa phage LS06-2018-MD03]|nr:hypothetical protein TPMD03_22 [Thiohalocapsa phage LS06-2018-MD03]
MINKELLSEVLGEDISECSIICNQVNYIVSNYEREDGELIYINLSMNINIHELAHKCKEWIFSKNYYFHIEEYNSNDVTVYIYKKDASCRDDFEEILSAKNYIEAIIKACEWIYFER